MIYLIPADGDTLAWARARVAADHYLKTVPDHRTRPFAYVVMLAGGETVGCLFFGRAEATRCYTGGLTYGSREDVLSGRAAFDRWEVINLSRVWLSPDVQPGGRFCSQARIPGFFDRRSVWRPALASAVIRLALGRIGFDYLAARPPVFVEQPYQIRAALSYCDTRLHRGVVYRAAGFTLARTNAAGVQTWWTSGVKGLTPDQDDAIRTAARRDPRARTIRERARTLFPVGGGLGP